MDTAETIEVFAPIVAVLVGFNLAQRDKRTIGVALVAAAVFAAVVLAVSGSPRPLLGLVFLAGFVGGIIVDAKGKRALGLAGIAVGMLALYISYFYT